MSNQSANSPLPLSGHALFKHIRNNIHWCIYKYKLLWSQSLWMWLLNVPFQNGGHWSAALAASSLLGKLFTRYWTWLQGFLPIQAQRGINSFEVRALCRPVMFFHTKLKTIPHTAATKLLLSQKMSLFVVALSCVQAGNSTAWKSTAPSFISIIPLHWSSGGSR